MKTIVNLFGVCVALLALCTSNVSAQEADKKKELPQSGTLSASGASGTDVKVPGVWGGDGGSGERSQTDSAPIAGGVYRINPGTWKASVQNSSIDTYSADLEVVQLNERGSTVKSDSFSVTIKPGESYERNFSANSSSRQALLNLRGWRRLTKNTPQPKE